MPLGDKGATLKVLPVPTARQGSGVVYAHARFRVSDTLSPETHLQTAEVRPAFHANGFTGLDAAHDGSPIGSVTFTPARESHPSRLP